ncbi:membrane dipeptidase [Steroidobacter sp. S1-65]|uniref:Membrane dipeptidase n=1 Tax=Steroidobacter gossypii TaxID=2805490 RepID=A0ABS1WZH5_9GAMM|nr:membrane dipeptidase [Steroidobacter gossypii]MBM0106384.1 membrane dipeptidase [Steroidobacter gossypii]
MNRREFTMRAGMAALMSTLSPAALASANQHLRWAPYADTVAIDMLAGVGKDADDAISATELAEIRASGLSAINVTIAPQGRFWFGAEAAEKCERQFQLWEGYLTRHPETFTTIRAGADLARAHREKRLGVIYGFQDTSPIGEDLSRIDAFHQRGVRVIQLTHNRRNLVGDGAMEPGNAGLSRFGHQMIEALESKRIAVDLAHGGRRTTMEAIKAAKKPVLIGHTGCAALSDLPRNQHDDVLRAMAERGGVAGIIFWPYLRRVEQPMAADVIAHIEHAMDVCGEDHVGIGTDATINAIDRTSEFETDNRAMIADMVAQGIFERGRPADLYTFIPDLNHPRRFETLGAMLSARGHSDARIHKILGGNFARVLGEIWG